MLDFLARNYGSIIVGAALIAALALAAVKTVKGRAGRGGCGCGCSECRGCAHSREGTKGAVPREK